MGGRCAGRAGTSRNERRRVDSTREATLLRRRRDTDSCLPFRTSRFTLRLSKLFSLLDAARMAGNGVPVLLVTANVGSIFEEVCTHEPAQAFSFSLFGSHTDRDPERSIAPRRFTFAFVTHATSLSVPIALLLRPRLARLSYRKSPRSLSFIHTDLYAVREHRRHELRESRVW